MIQILCFFFLNLRSLYGAANLIRLMPEKEKKRKKKTIVNLVLTSHTMCINNFGEKKGLEFG